MGNRQSYRCHYRFNANHLAEKEKKAQSVTQRKRKKICDAMKKTAVYLTFLFFVSINFLIPAKTQAIDQAEAQDVTVTAQVPSPVSPSKSEVTVSPSKSQVDTSTSEVIAGSGQKALITIKLTDESGNPITGKKVELRSNRGDIDVISPVTSQNPATSALGIDSTQAADSNRTNITDQNGIAMFTVYSEVAGDVTFTVWADNIILLDKTIKVIFSSPPFPSALELTVDLPSFGNLFSKKSFDLFNSGKKDVGVASETSRDLVNSTTKINLSFWTFIILGLIGLGIPAFLIIVIVLLAKINKVKQRENEVIDGYCLARGCPKRLKEPEPIIYPAPKS